MEDRGNDGRTEGKGTDIRIAECHAEETVCGRSRILKNLKKHQNLAHG
jgi:hypothetical protein